MYIETKIFTFEVIKQVVLCLYHNVLADIPFHAIFVIVLLTNVDNFRSWGDSSRCYLLALIKVPWIHYIQLSRQYAMQLFIFERHQKPNIL